MNNLKEIDDKTYLKAIVIMLQSDKPSYLQIIQRDILTRKEGTLEIHDSPWSDVDDDFKPQHLYVLSNDDIQEGDYYLCLHDLVVFKAIWKNDEFKDPNILKTNKKIIATTDESLNESIEMVGRKAKEAFDKILPNIPKEFIKEFVESYNSVNPIENVLVEYDKGFNGFSFDGKETNEIKRLGKIKLDENYEINITTRSMEFLKKYPKESIGKNKWSELEKIGSPDKWIKMYLHYQDLLVENDAREFVENIPNPNWNDIEKILDEKNQQAHNGVYNLNDKNDFLFLLSTYFNTPSLKMQLNENKHKPKERACTQDIVDEAMRIVSKDVRLPQCVLDGKVKPKNKK